MYYGFVNVIIVLRKSSAPLSVCANEGSSLARKYSKSGVSAKLELYYQ